MKLKKINCPYCQGTIEADIENRKFIYCSYCGGMIEIDNEKKEVTYNKNVNIKKDISHRYVDEAEIVKSNNETKKDRYAWIYIFVLLAFGLLIALGCGLDSWHRQNEKNIAISQGKVSAGYHEDLEGKDYRSVKAHFEAAGFTNIELIELKDSGIAVWNKGKVETISIGGDTHFDSSDYFDKDTKVVISYH